MYGLVLLLLSQGSSPSRRTIFTRGPRYRAIMLSPKFLLMIFFYSYSNILLYYSSILIVSFYSLKSKNILREYFI